MDTESTTPTQDKQVTVAVPEDRVAEFYAFYARFLAGRRGRRGPRGHGPGGRCGHGPRRGRPEERGERAARGEPEERGEREADPTVGEA